MCTGMPLAFIDPTASLRTKIKGSCSEQPRETPWSCAHVCYGPVCLKTCITTKRLILIGERFFFSLEIIGDLYQYTGRGFVTIREILHKQKKTSSLNFTRLEIFFRKRWEIEKLRQKKGRKFGNKSSAIRMTQTR